MNNNSRTKNAQENSKNVVDGNVLHVVMYFAEKLNLPLLLHLSGSMNFITRLQMDVFYVSWSSLCTNAFRITLEQIA